MTGDQKGLTHYMPESKQVEVEEQIEKFHKTITNALATAELEMLGYGAFLRDLLYGDDLRFMRRKF